MKFMKGLLKKNQVIIYVIALMIVTAGYLNYTTNTAEQVSTQTAMEMEANDDMQIADIGDATLVNSEAVSENEVEENAYFHSEVTFFSDTIPIPQIPLS